MRFVRLVIDSVRHGLLCLLVACLLSLPAHGQWSAEIPAYATLPIAPLGALNGSHLLPAAEAAMRKATAADQAYSAECVDYHFLAATHLWQLLNASRLLDSADQRTQRVWQLYHQNLAKLISDGQRYGRLDPRRGLIVNTSRGAGQVSLLYRGFPWHPDDFNLLLLKPQTNSPELRSFIHQTGLGLPLVVVRQRPEAGRFVGRRSLFAATAVLRTGMVTLAKNSSSVGVPTVGTLELYDPVRIESAPLAGRLIPITRDLSAPFSVALRNSDRGRLRDFLEPGRLREGDGLQMLEPYQRGKVPLIFVHGLLSDKMTWVNLANEMRAAGIVNNRYQIWSFQYPTAEPFLRSATKLRNELTTVLANYDPHGCDPALRQMVLIGHSMGGLVSKLQVTSSGTTIWDRVSRVPFEQVRATPDQRERLRSMFFFEPHPAVRRVVFIGTPHGGSSWATRFAGRLASRLVNQPAERVALHANLIQNNPGVFESSIQRRLPTSIDLLEPRSPLLAGMKQLVVNPHVRLHSIIGTGRRMIGSGAADGVVSVASAQHPGVVSERLINARHRQLHSHPETMMELVRILKLHLVELDGYRL